MPDRCFLALELPRPVSSSLLRAGDAFLDLAPGWRGEKWVRAVLLHITLEFYGGLTEPEARSLAEHLKIAAADIPSFAISLKRVEAVPKAARATMLWATFSDPAGAVSELRDRLLIDDSDPSSRPFRPHVTLVRARRPRRATPDAIAAATRVLSAAGKEPDGMMSVRSVTLYSSTLTAAGPDYRIIATAALAG